MGFLDKVKAQTEQVVKQGQDKIDEAQAKRKADGLLRSLRGASKVALASVPLGGRRGGRLVGDRQPDDPDVAGRDAVLHGDVVGLLGGHHNQVGPAYDALKADPSRAVTADQVRARLAAEHAKAQ